MNERLEPIAKEEWELETGLRRMVLRNLGGRKLTWRWDERHGKIVRKGKGGVDWYRYQKVGSNFLPWITRLAVVSRVG